MGSLFAKLSKANEAHIEPKRILMVGLDNAGKTTILYTLSLGETVTKTVPTIGFNVQTVTHKDITMSVWDVGGQSKIRGLWHHYLKGTHAIIYVVDSADTERLNESAKEFQSLLQSPEVKSAIVLVMANKRDLPGCASLQEIKAVLGVDKIAQRCHVEETIATMNEGLKPALDWVHNQLSTTSPPPHPATLAAAARKNSIVNAKVPADRQPVLTIQNAYREGEFKIAPLVTPHRSSFVGTNIFNHSTTTSTPVTSLYHDGCGNREPSDSTGAISPHPLVLTLQEAADMIKCSKDDVCKLLLDGSIKGKKISGEWRISTRTLLDYLEF